MVKENKEKNSILLYEDESDFHLNPQIGKMWQTQGKQNKIQAAGQNYKCHCFGAIDIESGEIIHKVLDRKRSIEYVEFLKFIEEKYKGKKVYMVVDNFIIHKTKLVYKFIKNCKCNIIFLFLPTYAPHLNPMENVWRVAKSKVVKNHFHKTLDNLKEAINKFFHENKKHLSDTFKMAA